MVLAEPKTIHSLKELENKLSAPTGDPDKNAYRYNSGKGYESYDLKTFLFSRNPCNYFAINVLICGMEGMTGMQIANAQQCEVKSYVFTGTLHWLWLNPSPSMTSTTPVTNMYRCSLLSILPIYQSYSHDSPALWRSRTEGLPKCSHRSRQTKDHLQP